MTHPIQYYSPYFRSLARASDLTVYYAHRQTPEGQAEAGFGRPFAWDIPLLDGYDWRWLTNVAARPGLSTFGGCDTPEIAGLIAQARFDAFLMFGWNRLCFLQASWAALRARTPLLVRLDSTLTTARSIPRRILKTPLYSALLPRVADYLSPGVRTDAYLRRYGVPDGRIHRLAHMVDVERFRVAAAAARRSGATRRLRRRHGAKPEDFIFLFAGKLIAKKRPMLMLEALRRLFDLAPEERGKIKLWIVGDGVLRADLERFALAHDLPVAFLGFANQSVMPEVYAASDCLVLPSSGEETWGLVVNEAYACGVPAIVSAEAGCAPDLVVEGRTGWLMTAPDPDHLARLMLESRRRASGLSRAPLDALSDAGSYAVGVDRLLDVVTRLGSRR